MNISKTIDQASDSLEKVDWKQLTKEIVDLWVAFFKVIVTLAVLTYLIGKHLGQGIHRLNDWLAAKWLQVLGLTGPTELGRASPTTVEIVEETIAVEVEPKLPPATTEVVEIQALQEQKPPPARRRRRNSAKEAPLEVVKAESATVPTRRSRGRGAHQDKQRARRAGQAA